MSTKNVGPIDRFARLATSIFLTIWIINSAPVFDSLTATCIIVFFALINAHSAIFSLCFVYRLFGISTYGKSK